MNKDEICIFVLACGKYEWIYKYFWYFAEKNLFPYIGNIPFYFFVESGNGCVITGKNWGDRFKKTLISLTEYKNVIYLQEDFLIKYVDVDSVLAAIELHNTYDNYITKLGTNYEFETYPFPEKINNLQIYRQRINDEYLMSHQPVSIYNREFLLETITEQTDNASAHEIIGSKIMREIGKTKIMTIGPKFYPKNKSIIFEIEHAICKGELLPDAKKMMEEYDNEKQLLVN
jgi:hypothetical protein